MNTSRFVAVMGPTSFLQRTVAEVLHKVLGHILVGIDKESFNLSVWSGDVRLSGCSLNTASLDLLLAGLPVRVLGGHLGQVSIKLPWRSLSGSKVAVHVDRVYIVLGTKDEGSPVAAAADREAKAKRKLAARRAHLDAWELLQSRKQTGSTKASLVSGVARRLLRRLAVSVTNVHVRLVDESSGSLQLGATLPSLELGEQTSEPTIPTPMGAAVHKRVVARGLALYVGHAAPVVISSPGPTAPAGQRTSRARGSDAGVSRGQRSSRSSFPIEVGMDRAGGVRTLDLPTDGASWDQLMQPMLLTQAHRDHVLAPISAAVSLAIDLTGSSSRR